MKLTICKRMDHTFRFTCNILIHAFVSFPILLLPLESRAGEYHSSLNGTLFCDECHQLSSPSGGESEDGLLGDRQGDDPSRLTDPVSEMGNKVCTSCHDNNPEVSDVVGMNTGRSPGIAREAGALSTFGGGFPYSEANGHTLGTHDPAPGSNPMWFPDDGLMCIDCHNPHGENPNGNPYRNLSATPGNTPRPGLVVTYSVGSFDPSRDVFVRSQSNYDVSNVDFNEPVSSYSAIAEFCKGCHTGFHGTRGGTEVGGALNGGWVRHPSSDANIGWAGERHSSKEVFAGDWTQKENFVKVMTSTGNWSPRSAREVEDHSPTCLTCHKAHGNRNPFGLVFMGNTGPITEEGTPGGTYIDLCRQCHIQSVQYSLNN